MPEWAQGVLRNIRERFTALFSAGRKSTAPLIALLIFLLVASVGAFAREWIRGDEVGADGVGVTVDGSAVDSSGDGGDGGGRAGQGSPSPGSSPDAPVSAPSP